MNRLIRFEMNATFKRLSFYVCALCIILMSVLGVYMEAVPELLFGNLKMSMLNQIGFCGARSGITAISFSDFPVLIGIYASLSICTDYSQKTMKNVWSRGFSRTQVFFAKAFSVVVVSLIYGLLSIISAFITGTLLWGVGSVNPEFYIISVLVQLTACIGIGLAFNMTSFAFKKMGLAIVTAVIGPSLLSLGSSILDAYMQYKEIAFEVSPYVLSNVMYNFSNNYTDSLFIAKTFLTAVGYIVFSLYLGWMSMRKDQL